MTFTYTYTSGSNSPPPMDLLVPITYIPKNNQPTPAAPLTVQDLTTTYYFVQCYQDFIDNINVAMATGWSTLSAQVQASLGRTDMPANNVPFLQFDPDTGRIIASADATLCSDLVGTPSVPNPKVTIWFNSRLYELLSSLPAYDAGPVGSKNYRIQFINNYNTNVSNNVDYTTGLGASVNYNVVQAFQEVSTVAMWNPIASIVFSSSMLPVLSTNISPPKVFNDPSNTLASTGNNCGIFSILTDFEVAYSNTNQYRPTIDFTPGAEYRLLDMNSITNLNKVDISLFWKTHYGEYIPFKLQPGCAAHIKLMFRHRTFYFGL
jgi:hypothetical protein